MGRLLNIIRVGVWFVVLNVIANQFITEPVSYWWVIEIIILGISGMMVDKSFEE